MYHRKTAASPPGSPQAYLAPAFLTDVRLARVYFALQGIAGGLWWLGVFTIEPVRTATLGTLNPTAIFLLDFPIFVLGSAAIAWVASRNAGHATRTLLTLAWIVGAWTGLVAIGMAIYATITASAGLGALIMICAALGTVWAGVLVATGNLPVEQLLRGPFAFRTAKPSRRSGHLLRTAIQIVAFWGFFLILLPWVIRFVERQWGLAFEFPTAVQIIGGVALACASVVAIWSAATMATQGKGTPLPADMAAELVTSGPYAYVRNPMAVASIAQGVAVGLLLGSWMVVAYAVAGGLAWDWGIRPQEEADMSQRFGGAFTRYRERVRCWVPRFSS